MEAFLLLGLARMAILVVPFRRIAVLLGQAMAESPLGVSDGKSLAGRVSWAVQTAGRHTPWESKCLAQAVAAKVMLKRRAVSSTLYLGLAKDEEQKLEAHAWLRYGRMILTGGPHHERFTVVATFAERLP